MKKLFAFLIVIFLFSCSSPVVVENQPPVQQPQTPSAPTEVPPPSTTSTPVPSSSEGKKEQIILIEKGQYNPSFLAIPVGTTVTWINNDQMRTYKVNEKRKLVIGPRMEPHQNFTYLFNDPGTYEIFDSIKPGIQGKIIVKNEETISGAAISSIQSTSLETIVPLFIMIGGLIPLFYFIKKERKRI